MADVIQSYKYLDLFAGKNDHEVVKRAGAGGHKEINDYEAVLEADQDVMRNDAVR